MPLRFPFDNTYARLPERFYARVAPTKVREPCVVAVNRALAETLGIDADALGGPEGAQVLSGNVVPEGADPMALAYAGHQFGSFVRQLGDGRAILLGEIVGTDGVRRDVQLKGAGRTPFSRGGDGRAAIGPVLREYVVSEAMHALGIKTTRSLAAVTTGERVFRDTPLPGAVLTRVARSHVRVGTFQFFAARGDREALATLTAFALDRHYPDARSTCTTDSDAALALLDRVVAAQAELVASWLGVGFVHGVMNTDNTSIAGETIDYGPCAFLDEFQADKTFSSIDRGGRYAFANQPAVAHWNVMRLAECLLPLVSDEEEEAVTACTARVQTFASRFQAAFGAVMRKKLGLVTAQEDDLVLVSDLVERLEGVDWTIFFRALSVAADDPAAHAGVAALFGSDTSAFDAWSETWRRRLAAEPAPEGGRSRAMRLANPAFIPRNHRVEQAIEAAVDGDLRPFEELVSVLARPFDDQPDHAHLAEPPRPEERVERTFCGT